MRNFILAVFLFTLFVSPAFAAGKPVVKIGVSTALTGDNAHLGESMRDAMVIAKEELSANTKFDYELIFEDDALEARKAAAAANKLISIDKVDALVSFSSGTGGVISPIAEQNKVVHFGIASAQSVADGDYNFDHWTAPAEEARVMAGELQKRGFKKTSIIELNHPAFIAIRDSLKDRLAGTGVEIVSDDMINPEEKDFRTIIAKSKTVSPDIYVLLCFSPSLEIITKQLREAGVSSPLTSVESFSASSDMGLFEGAWYVDAADASKNFREKYLAKLNKEPLLAAPNAYDVFNLLVYAYENANAPAGVKPGVDNVIAALHTVKDQEGAMGKLSIDEKGMVFSPAAVKVIKNGKPVSEDAAASSAQTEDAPTGVEPAGAE